MKVLRIRDVCQKVGLSKASILRKSREGSFPARINIGVKAMGFFEEEIEQWLQEQAQKRKPAKVSPSKGVKS